MALTRRPPPRRKPDQALPSVGVGSTVMAEAAAPPASPRNVAAEEREQKLAEFEAMLQAQPGMTEAGLELVMQGCRDALDNVSLEPALGVPQRNEWIASIDALIEQGALDQASGDALVRQIDAAVAPLESPDVQRALELAGRIQRDGQAQAREWLESQSDNEASDDLARVRTNEAAVDSHPLRESITRSRSRRLRGPPLR
ncbi:hypothetical protein E5843_14030 [Luteimonas yindakuii]|uniref:hypothetical protein n=1 Tax=Luteimonas yindakuii TaxID=2565782 RepID=UPI0010A3F1F7|nr:hypothetical protein [Luteimonas yindakuii]QCO68607.1 hypothetical protein E5843_14030 [Luteimonas yindakuii]